MVYSLKIILKTKAKRSPSPIHLYIILFIIHADLCVCVFIDIKAFFCVYTKYIEGDGMFNCLIAI